MRALPPAILCGTLAMLLAPAPVHAQDGDCDGGYTWADSYLYEDSYGDLNGYSTTYNVCWDYDISVGVDSAIYDPDSNFLAGGSDYEYFDGSDASVYLSAQATIAGTYVIEGEHYICYYDGSWGPADPPYSSDSVSSPQIGPPAVAGDAFAYGTTWNAGTYGNITILGSDLGGEVPTITDTGCAGAWSVSAWSSSYSSITAYLSVYPYPSLTQQCTLTISLLTWAAQILLMPPPNPLTVAILVNNTADTGDDITALSPPQTIPAQVTLVGASGTVQLSVPSGRASLDQTSLSLTDGVPVTVTLTPRAQSQAPNDVQIIAAFGGAQVGQASLTVVGITLPSVNDPDTPQGMPNRIPPRVNTPMQVTVAPDLTGSGQSVTLAASGTSGNNGNFTINGASTLAITTSSTVNLSGTTQTAATSGNGGGHAGNLALVAQVRGQNAVTSSGFSVAAIPINWVDTYFGPINGGGKYGLAVDTSLSSDSSNLADLDQVLVSEQVSLDSESGSLAGVGPGTTAGYQSTAPAEDDFYSPQAVITWGEGKQVLDQTTTLWDKRTGSKDMPMANSGFTITRSVAADPAGAFHLTTSVTGAAVTANGFASLAGTCSPTSTLSVTRP